MRRKSDPSLMELPRGCNRCRSAPFVEDSSGGQVRCQCARGRELRARDLERAGKPRDNLKPAKPKDAYEGDLFS